jgi:hypothetical protein
MGQIKSKNVNEKIFRASSNNVMYRFGLSDWYIPDVIGGVTGDEIRNNGKFWLGTQCALRQVVFAEDDDTESYYTAGLDAISISGDTTYTRLIINRPSGIMSVGFRYNSSDKTLDWKTSDSTGIVKAIIVELDIQTSSKTDSLSDDSDELYINPINYVKELGKFILSMSGVVLLYYFIEYLYKLKP